MAMIPARLCCVMCGVRVVFDADIQARIAAAPEDDALLCCPECAWLLEDETARKTAELAARCGMTLLEAAAFARAAHERRKRMN